MKRRIGLVYNQNEIDGTTEFVANPHGAVQMAVTVQAINDALAANGWEVSLIPAGFDLLQRVRAAQVEVIFNASTGIARKTEQANVVAMLELLDTPFVGSGLATHVLGLYKQVAKLIFRQEGIPTPAFQVFDTADMSLDPELRFPLIVKPEHEGSSMGITRESIVDDEPALRRAVERVLAGRQHGALGEEFIDGREFNIGVLGNEDQGVLPITEIIFRAEEAAHRGTQTYDIKERDAVNQQCPAELTPSKLAELQGYARAAYRAFGCRGYARLDVRMDEAEIPYFLEINTLPGMQPGYSDFPRMAVIGGYDFAKLVGKLVDLALSGPALSGSAQSSSAPGAGKGQAAQL